MRESKNIKDLSPEDLVDSMVLPHRRKKADKEKADAELLKVLNGKRSSISKNEIREASLLSLKFQLEDYIKGEDYIDEYTFGYFLNNYLKAINKNSKDFAEEIDVNPNALKNWLTKNIEPNEEIFIRLEIHSNYIISAINWLKVIEKRKENRIQNAELRRAQGSHVKKHLTFSV